MAYQGYSASAQLTNKACRGRAIPYSHLLAICCCKGLLGDEHRPGSLQSKHLPEQFICIMLPATHKPQRLQQCSDTQPGESLAAGRQCAWHWAGFIR